MDQRFVASSPDIPPARPGTRNTRHLYWGFTFLGLFGLLSILMVIPGTHNALQRVDNSWRELIGVAPGASSYQWFLPLAVQHGFNTLGSILLCVAVITSCLVFKRYWHAAYVAISALLVAAGLAQLFKFLVSRARPAEDPTRDLWASIFPVDQGSFPSGHSTAAAVFVVCLFVLIPQHWSRCRAVLPWLAPLILASVIWQRTLTNAHWLSDTFAGIFLGLGGSLVVWYWLQPRLDSENALRLKHFSAE